jgi:hypothetical protein
MAYTKDEAITVIRAFLRKSGWSFRLNERIYLVLMLPGEAVTIQTLI